MDKLWASAWRRNQTEIGALNKTLMTLKASSEKNTKTLSSETADNNTAIEFVKMQLENQSASYKLLNEKFSQTNKINSDFEQQLATLREKLISTALANNNLTNQIDDLRRRVLAVEKKANDVRLSTAPIIAPQL
jgi:septal ring factor EnvC (AmiA/AmiB activator)